MLRRRRMSKSIVPRVLAEPCHFSQQTGAATSCYATSQLRGPRRNPGRRSSQSPHLVMCVEAFVQNTGPAPKTGNGAKLDGSIDTTGRSITKGNITRDKDGATRAMAGSKPERAISPFGSGTSRVKTLQYQCLTGEVASSEGGSYHAISIAYKR